MPRDESTLIDLERAARLAIEFTERIDRPSFLGDVKTQSAALHQLMVLGEAVKRLLADPDRAAALAKRGRDVILSRQGATDRHVALLLKLMPVER